MSIYPNGFFISILIFNWTNATPTIVKIPIFTFHNAVQWINLVVNEYQVSTITNFLIMWDALYPFLFRICVETYLMHFILFQKHRFFDEARTTFQHCEYKLSLCHGEPWVFLKSKNITSGDYLGERKILRFIFSNMPEILRMFYHANSLLEPFQILQ